MNVYDGVNKNIGRYQQRCRVNIHLNQQDFYFTTKTVARSFDSLALFAELYVFWLRTLSLFRQNEGARHHCIPNYVQPPLAYLRPHLIDFHSLFGTSKENLSKIVEMYNFLYNIINEKNPYMFVQDLRIPLKM